MCDCLETVGERMKQRLMEKVPEGAEVKKGFDTGWENTCLSLSGGGLIVMLKYKLAYRANKKDGSPAKNLTRMDGNVTMNYCPFCGEKMA